MDIAYYLDRITREIPTLAVSTLRAEGDGLANDVIIINDELVFRFPKDDRTKRTLAREVKILNLLRFHVAMPVPAIEYQTEEFVMYRWLPGRALHQSDLLRQDDRIQDQLAEQLATFLWQLHSIPRALLEEQGIALADSVRSREAWIELYHDAERELFPLLMTYAKEWLTWHFAPLFDGSLDLTYEPALVHGDLGPYHILYTEEAHRIKGVIDFGTSGLGDPADDLANIINGLGESFLKRMYRYYPAIREALDRARFWAGTLEIQWALGGLGSHDPSWFTVHLGRARDVMPLGVRYF